MNRKALDAFRSNDAWRLALRQRGAHGVARRTPLLRSQRLAQLTGAREAFTKAESLQRTGSFKVRGAALRIAALAEGQTRVVAASAGNHGLGLAWAAQHAGKQATIVVPTNSPRIKRAGIIALGAELIVHGDGYDAAEAHARRIAKQTQAVFVSAFDDDYIIAGNGGTLAFELVDQLPDGIGGEDVLVFPVGGGGLASGIAVALADTGCALFGVEPEKNCVMKQSFDKGTVVETYVGEPTVADGLEGAISSRTYALCREGLRDVRVVSEPAIERAMAWAYHELGLILEPSGVVGLAALLERKLSVQGRRVIWIATGANVDTERLDASLSRTWESQ